MNENLMPTEKGFSGAGLALNAVEIVVGAAVDFAKAVAPDELKPKVQNVQESRESLGDVLRMAAVRAELSALGGKRSVQTTQIRQEPVLPAAAPPAI